MLSCLPVRIIQSKQMHKFKTSCNSTKANRFWRISPCHRENGKMADWNVWSDGMSVGTGDGLFFLRMDTVLLDEDFQKDSRHLAARLIGVYRKNALGILIVLFASIRDLLISSNM